jgi:hypothetical protein
MAGIARKHAHSDQRHSAAVRPEARVKVASRFKLTRVGIAAQS